MYEEPAVIHSRSHSFVGPTNCVNPTPTLSKLGIDDPLEVLCEDDDEIISEKSVNDIGDNSDETFRLEDFEILKLVGQGAFGKVYQVRKIGSSEIYAMKVMLKDKIMEKNHAEYMKAERDILTKIDHPFIVQLRYSFQVVPSSKVQLSTYGYMLKK